MTKEIKIKYKGKPPHMVGDGFRVSSYLPNPEKAKLRRTSPFFLLDYNEPYKFPPTPFRKGVGSHPHRGFETVTVVFEGNLAHRDSSGGGGEIGPGDVQWMTAANGVLHDEFQTQEFSEKGGVQHMLQLWVNLPAKDKTSSPKYQSITRQQIPVKQLDETGSSARIIAGTFMGVEGPAATFTPVEMYDLNLKAGAEVEFDIPAHFNTMLLMTGGSVKINGSETARFKDFVVFSNKGERIELQASEESRIFIIAGEPIDEPIAHYGPFLMNTREELAESIESFNAGEFGRL